MWRRAHDRFERGLDRFHQVLEGIEDDPQYNELYNGLASIANRLADELDEVRRICVRAQAARPSEGTDIPPGASAVHRALSKAANDLAQAAQAAAMARLDAESHAAADLQTGLDSVRRRADVVVEGVASARAAADALG
ncbi:hypothetical protein GCM10022377_25680 [Zhihengliuella alba]|uniref:Uncharacterized protein n=1 Tax=Zhihengliuella alba TaxID=547018 RepID=A0ABP7DW78_9MICC